MVDEDEREDDDEDNGGNPALDLIESLRELVASALRDVAQAPDGADVVVDQLMGSLALDFLRRGTWLQLDDDASPASLGLDEASFKRLRSASNSWLLSRGALLPSIVELVNSEDRVLDGETQMVERVLPLRQPAGSGPDCTTRRTPSREQMETRPRRNRGRPCTRVRPWFDEESDELSIFNSSTAALVCPWRRRVLRPASLLATTASSFNPSSRDGGI